jgi:hypothetical protein
MDFALPYIAKEEEKKKKKTKKRKITTTSHRVRINGQTPRRSEEDHNKPSYKETSQTPEEAKNTTASPRTNTPSKLGRRRKRKRDKRGGKV